MAQPAPDPGWLTVGGGLRHWSTERAAGPTLTISSFQTVATWVHTHWPQLSLFLTSMWLQVSPFRMWKMATEHLQKITQFYRLGKDENLRFSATFWKIKLRLSTLGLMQCRIKRRHKRKLKNSATRGRKKYGAAVSIEDLRKPHYKDSEQVFFS